MARHVRETKNATVPPQAERLGLDDEGGEQYWSRPRQTVYVREESGVTRAFELVERDLDEWVQHVRRVRGWCDLQYRATSDPAEALFGTSEPEAGD